jgi:JAB1/Mov34/MPN/PAD-1 ubiquitin protease
MCAVRILQQPMPLARSILWAPTGASRPGDLGIPIFLRQSALQAIYEHLAAPPPPGQGILGFLLGDRCECPVSGVPYSVIDAALRLNQTIYGDRSRDVVTRLWKRLAAQLEAQQAHLIGWYHTHPPLPLEFSVHDVETHEQYFGDPWQVGVLVGTDPATPAGAFFRLGSDDAWVRTPQQFYELLNEDSVRAGGKKRSFMTWKTYRAYNPPALQPRSSPRPPPRAAEPSGTVPGLEQTALVTPPSPRVPPRPVEEPAEQAAPEESEPTGMENMPQAELEEPGRVELDAPAASPPHRAAEEQEEESDEPEEWEDEGALKFLSAAEDSPPPPPVSPGAPSPFLPPPLPLSFARPEEPPREAVPTPASDELDSAWAEDRAVEEGAVEDQALEPSEAPAPERPAKQRRGSRGILRKVLRSVAVLAGVLLVVAGSVASWPYVPGLLQRLKSLVPSRLTGASDTPPPPPVSAPAAPTRVAPPPIAPRPPIVPRAEFALLDQAADSLGRALQAYGARARLFEKRRLDCFVLSRGAVRVERSAATYGFQRNATRATLDAPRGARDLELRAGLDSASRQFLRSACEHP